MAEGTEDHEKVLATFFEEAESDRLKFEAQLVEQFHRLFGQVLDLVELALPQTDQPSPKENALKFTLVRSKILGAGNDVIRDVKQLLQNYCVKELYRQERVVVKFPGRGKI